MVKLTKKEQAILDSLQKPYSVNEIVSKINILTQNLVKYIYNDIINGANLVQEVSTITIPARSEEYIATHIGLSSIFDTKEIDYWPEQQVTGFDHSYIKDI
jgi:hypothetical protein